MEGQTQNALIYYMINTAKKDGMRSYYLTYKIYFVLSVERNYKGLLAYNIPQCVCMGA